MKTIIVPTDFSAVSINALHYALNMAKEIGASVTLFHAYQIPVSFSEVPVVTITMEEMQSQTDKKMNELKNSVEHISSGEVAIHIKNALGDTIEELENLCIAEDVFSVVMGTRGAGAMEVLFLGSTTLSAINQLKVPVMIIPPGATYRPIKKLGFACDYSQVADSTPIREIRELCQTFRAELKVLNVDYENRKFTPEVPISLTKVHELLDPLDPEYHFIDDPNVEDGINKFAETHGIDMLITIPKKHRLLDNIFRKSHTRKLALHAHVPIVAIHE
jgi:nucleotide-binding universal stress UspA family protein